MIKDRAIERGTLKHSKGSKWSQNNKKLRSKDEELRKQINSQAALNVNLRQKTLAGMVESDDSEDENQNVDEGNDRQQDAV